MLKDTNIYYCYDQCVSIVLEEFMAFFLFLGCSSHDPCVPADELFQTGMVRVHLIDYNTKAWQLKAGFYNTCPNLKLCLYWL